MLIVLMIIPLCWVIFVAPESPLYLLSKKKYNELSVAMERVCKINGCYDHTKIIKIVSKLKKYHEFLDKQIDNESPSQLHKSNHLSLFHN